MTPGSDSAAWRQFVMNLDRLDRDTVEQVFNRHGAASVTLSDAADDPVLEPAPGETPLWTETCITGLFPADADLVQLERDLCRELDLDVLPPHRIEVLADRHWEREWLQHFGPMQFGQRLWILPGDSQVSSADAVIVRLDPGLAFGTGSHATTALCLEWLDRLPLQGKTMLDYGCGSGVLATAALRLGCRAATAMDIDPQAVTATRRNAARNSVARRLSVCSTPEAIAGRFDVVVANILAGALTEFAESITSRLASRGILALSGVLSEQAADVQAAYAPWIEFERPVFREQDGQVWARLTGTRRQDE